MEDLEFEILDAIYFVEPFENILKEVNEKRIPVIKDCLKKLINKQWIKVMVWDDKSQNYISSIFYDFDQLEDMHFLISKDGLLAHNSRMD